MKKGKLDPFAFVALDPKVKILLNDNQKIFNLNYYGDSLARVCMAILSCRNSARGI
jgi:hypothetical protein